VNFRHNTKTAAALQTEQTSAATITDLAHKLTLSLVETSQLSGLSRNHLREAIEQKKLRARIIGRGWWVKREDLVAFVRML